jgi:hypothetical protein
MSEHEHEPEEEHKLDVDFEIIEDPVDEHFPRLPNVVSHRGHKVKILAVIHEVPNPDVATRISLNASVYVFGRETMGRQQHVSSTAHLWGQGREVTIDIPADPQFPVSIPIFVERTLNDDHLGEGPGFQAFANVRTSPVVDNAAVVEPANVAPEGPAPSSTNIVADVISNDGLFVINFSSK